MKLSDRYSYIVLCEDVQTRCFLNSFFQKQGINRHRIRVNMAPSGRKCGSQYVAQMYPKMRNDINSKNYRKVILLVCADADNLSIAEREQFVERNVQDLQYNRQKEMIILWIPKRQIENWIYFWREGSGEEEEHRHSGHAEKCKAEAGMMSEYLTGSNKTDNVLPSMEQAKKEYERVCMLQK